MTAGLTPLVQQQLAASAATLQALAADDALHQTLIALAERTADALRAGHKLLIAGNGGSAADAQHLAAEFVMRLTVDRPALRAIALTTDTSILTAVGNDWGYQHVFSRQIEALGQPGDLFLAISTSGNSESLLLALQQARTQGLVTAGLVGHTGGRMPPLCDYTLIVHSSETARIQEAHLALEHIFCTLVERFTFGPHFGTAPQPLSD